MSEKKIKLMTVDGQKEVSGNVVHLMVGHTKRKFFIHEALTTTDKTLSDYVSGYRVGDLRQMKLRDMRTGFSMTDREAAQRLLDWIVAKSSPDDVLAIMNKAEKIN